jgi:hypothetical protein
MKENFKKYWKVYLIALAVSLFIGIAIFLIYFLVGEMAMMAAINGSTLSCVILLGFGGLMFVTNEGFFDVFSYGFKQLFTSMFGRKANEDNNFAGYKEQNRIKRETSPKIYLSVLSSGIIFLIVMIVLRIVGFTK